MICEIPYAQALWIVERKQQHNRGKEHPSKQQNDKQVTTMEVMNDKEFDSALRTVIHHIKADGRKFNQAVSSVAQVAGEDREKLEQLKIWSDTIERVVFGETAKKAIDFTKHIENIKSDKSVTNCLVYLSDGDDCVIYKHGDSEDICFGTKAAISKDNTCELYQIFEDILVETTCDDVLKFAKTLHTFNGMVDDFKGEGIAIPNITGSDYIENELDLLVSAKVEY